MQNELLSFNRNKLNKTQTKVTYLSGKRIKEDIYSEKVEEINDEDAKSTVTIEGYVIDVAIDLSCDEIVPNLFLSGMDVAEDVDTLKSKSITHIVNCTSSINNKFESTGDIKYHRVPIDDLPNVNILQYFDAAFAFIDNALIFDENSSKNRVLVHCHAGVSRSVSFVIGYLLKKRLFINYKDAYEHVKSARPVVCPNPGFVVQLKHYEQSL